MLPRCTAVTAVFLLVSTWAVSASEVCKMSGRVVDQTGAAVPHAFVLVYAWHRGSEGTLELQEVGKLRSDRSGEFAATFPEGTYEVFCAHRGLLPAAGRINLTPTAEARISLQLRFDPVHPPAPCCDATVPTD
jgi:hypothetical protein